MYFPRQIHLDTDGNVRLHLQRHEVALLRELFDELEALLEDPEDPALRRLFPPAHTDRESEEQYRLSLVRTSCFPVEPRRSRRFETRSVRTCSIPTRPTPGCEP